VSELTIFGTPDDPTGKLTISKSLDLTKLVFKDFKDLQISGCKKLKSVVCNDASGLLQTVSITDCPEITSLEIPIDNVTTIDLTGCLALSSITLKGDSIESFDKLKKLILTSTNIVSIEYRLNGNSDANSEHITEYLDLTKFPNLSIDGTGSFNIQKNSSVKRIKFLNRKDTPVILSNKFTSCSSLERVYGHIRVNTTSMFADCTKFSIHGDITTGT
jgi:hypothetical protein